MKILDYAQVWTPAMMDYTYIVYIFKLLFGSFRRSGTAEWNDFIQLSVDSMFGFN